MTATTKVANEYGWRVEKGTRENEQRFGKTLDEDVKIGVILALAPLQVQNHCHLYSHILRCCLITAEHKRIRPLVMLYPWISRCWVKCEKARKAKAKARKAKAAKTKRTKTRKAKAKVRTTSNRCIL